MSPAEQPQQSPETSGPAVALPENDSRTPQIMKGSGGNVDKIRDILFGSQMRDYEARFNALEQTLLKETSEIRETSRRRFDQLENYIKSEFEAIQTRLKAERDDRTDMASQHSREQKELSESFSRRLRDLDDRSAGVERDLRSQLLRISQDLGDELRTGHNDITSVFEKRVQELRHAKTDRASLAALFTEVALRLNNQFEIPGSNE
jgi:DNA anti-recombination protein RmuC